MKKLPEMEQPPAGIDVRRHRLRYRDGSEREIFCTEAEYFVPNGMMIVSRTDLDGFITNVNVDFIDASGYSKEEILGQPHFILRHPDMPKAAFKDLWETLQSGGTWTGIVKNLRKDGGFYWVRAVVKPVQDGEGRVIGYHSVRKRITRDEAREAQLLYDAMRATEM